MAWTTSYYHYDALGSTRALTDSNQATTDSYVYNAYGEGVSATGSSVNPFRYVGELGYYFDADTETTYVRARHYDPQIVRWLSRDPLGFDENRWDVYLYARLNPTGDRDPSGLWVPPYDEDNVQNCLSILKDAVLGGRLRNMPCASELLRLFLFGNMNGKTVCPKACSDELSNADWGDVVGGNIKSRLKAAADCDASGRETLPDMSGNYCFEDGGDLQFALHCVTWKTRDGACSWNCAAAQGCCCPCDAQCGFNVTVEDTYDFCSSLAPPGKGREQGVGRTLAECGCIIEDWKKKRGQPNTYKISCPVGDEQIHLNYKLCYPKPPI